MITKELIHNCIKQDAAARRQLIELCSETYMGLCYRYAKDIQQAQQFFKQGIKDMLANLPECSQHADEDGKWLINCFIKSVVTQMRNNRSEYYITTTTRVEDKKQKPGDLFHQAEEENPNGLEAIQYIKALQKLPSSFRAIYNLHVIDGYSLPKAAEILEISEYSAQNSLERARYEFGKNVQLQILGY